MSEADLSRYFLHRTFTGGSAAGPRTLATRGRRQALRLQRAGRHRRSSGSPTSTTRVKALKVDDAAPGDAAYALVMGEP